MKKKLPAGNYYILRQVVRMGDVANQEAELISEFDCAGPLDIDTAYDVADRLSDELAVILEGKTMMVYFFRATHVNSRGETIATSGTFVTDLPVANHGFFPELVKEIKKIAGQDGAPVDQIDVTALTPLGREMKEGGQPI